MSSIAGQPLINVEGLEPQARAILSRSTYDYFAGGAEDEATLHANRQAYSRYRFRFHTLSSSAQPDLSCRLLGSTVAMPVQLAPTATQKLAHPDGEVGAARAAAAAGVIYCLSTMATTSLEEVATASGGRRWFQVYMYNDRGISADHVDRAVAAGYSAIVVTVDTPRLGRRERDLRNGFALPAHLRYENLKGALASAGGADIGSSALARYFSSLIDPSLSWKDLEWLVSKSRVPVLVKGVVRADDARRAVASGAAGVIVSNHGGRQLDYAIATLDALPEVAEAVGSGVPVLLDGGIRRGTDVLKALALGAVSVLIGRPFLWALAIDGENGVGRLLEHLREEIAMSMTLLGVKSLAELGPDLLSKA